MEIIINRKWYLRLPLMVGCGQVCLLSDQIARFFDQQYLCKESIHILDFLNGDIHQGKVACATTAFSWERLIVLLGQSGFMILCSTLSLGGLNLYLCLTIFILSLFYYFRASFIKFSGFHLVMTCSMLYMGESSQE